MSHELNEVPLWTRRDLQRLRLRYTRAELLQMAADGEFPQPVITEPGREAWLLEEVKAWLRHKINARSPAVNRYATDGTDRG
jgi:predicted DNA-binding transcriptional regulator AlpA